jgi:SAM-dependent methyltransferase
LCHSQLLEKSDFHSHGVDYTFCLNCTHLNGIFEDSQSFIEKLYISDNGKEYSSDYLDKEFVKRTVDIYIPKIEFLKSCLAPNLFNNYEILDVGCGSGYFTYAAILSNLRAQGIDVNLTMTEFGNNQIFQLANLRPLKFIEEVGFYNSIINSNADVISAIGVIEHLRFPHVFFDAFVKSKARFLFYSVPMFSFSVILENIFKDVYPRQLSSAHTHVFTEQSILKMNEILGVKTIGEWRFGTDIMDLFRSVIVNLQKNNVSQKLMEYLYQGLGTKIDEIQSILDKNNFCSEIHCIVEKR